MVAPHCFSTKSLAHSFCSSVPSMNRLWAKEGPAAYIHRAGLAPRTSSAIAHQSIRGEGVPPSTSGRSRRQYSESMNERKDFLNDSGSATACFAVS